MESQAKILIARISGVHGIKGYVKIDVFAENPRAIEKYCPLYDSAGREYRVKIQGEGDRSGRVVASVKGISDRTAAEALRGTDLYASRAALGLKKGELLLSDLVGFAAVDSKSGSKIGKITAIDDYGGGDTLEISLPSGKSALVLLDSPAVKEILESDRKIRISKEFIVES